MTTAAPDRRYADLLADLAAEHAALDEVVAPLAEPAWDGITPAEGWTVRDQIGHLHYFDGTAYLSATEPAAFVAHRDEVLADLGGFEQSTLAFARSVPADELLGAWRLGREALVGVLGTLDARARLEWYGPPMGAMSFATARLMETWAHGQDVVDAVDADRPATDRLRHIADLGVRTRGFSYAVRGLDRPAGDVRVELAAPGGAVWEWGDPAAADRVRGPALDFCLVVTQRRHPADTDLVVEGSAAQEWMGIAQAFAGGPGPGRPPLTPPRGQER
jgi:uncharacterized protein (TIGR03084 family)